MAIVAVWAAAPSVRAGLAAMLAEHGHEMADPNTTPSCAVWVIDAPNSATLDRLDVPTGSEGALAVVALTDDPTVAARLAHAGLRGWACLGRDCSAADLSLAVHAADAGLALVDLRTASATVSAPSAPLDGTYVEPLTAREVQVLQLIAEGLPNKGIARALHISENTAKFHVASLCAKLGAASRVEAVTMGVRLGLIVL